jgi:hypothetical protein
MSSISYDVDVVVQSFISGNDFWHFWFLWMLDRSITWRPLLQ